MIESLKKHPKTTGIVLGLILGVPQGLTVRSEPVFEVYDAKMLVLVVLVGLLGPTFSALHGSFSGDGFQGRVSRKISSYVDPYLMFLVGSLSLGFTGLVTYMLFGGEKAAILTISFFIAAGVGLFFVPLISKRFD